MIAKKYCSKIKVIPSLGHHRYLSYMKQVEFVIGNSSSGIVETPFMNIPTINIGNRQKGRHQCKNIIQCNADYNSINNAIGKINYQNRIVQDDKYYWGDGHSSERIISILKSTLNG